MDLVPQPDTPHEGVLLLDRNLRIVHADTRAAGHVGGASEELLGRTFPECLQGAATAPLRSALQLCLAGQPARSLVAGVRTPAGAERRLELRLVPAPGGLFVLLRAAPLRQEPPAAEAPAGAAPARATTPQPPFVDLAQLLHELASGLRAGLGPRIDLLVQAEQATAPVPLDREVLTGLVQELVNLARSTIEGRGRITVTVAPGQRDGAPTAVLVVHDTGAGLAAATHAVAFGTPSAPGDQPPAGLLAARHLVQQHGGTLEVDSAPGLGTVCRAHLPTIRRLPGIPPAPPAARQRPKGTILVVDDMPEVAELIGRILAAAGHQVLLATGAEAALELWREQGPTIDVLVTDMEMPGLSGAELIARLRGDRPTLPAVCTSGFTATTTITPAAAGIVFLSKPFTAKQLASSVQQLLAAAGPTAASPGPLTPATPAGRRDR